MRTGRVIVNGGEFNAPGAVRWLPPERHRPEGPSATTASRSSSRRRRFNVDSGPAKGVRWPDDRSRNGRSERRAAAVHPANMARRRGYVLDYHKVMVKQDVTFMKACDGLVQAAYLENQRLLDRKTKELIFIVSLTVPAAPREAAHHQPHPRPPSQLGRRTGRSSRRSRSPARRPASSPSNGAWTRGVKSFRRRGSSPRPASVEGATSDDR